MHLIVRIKKIWSRVVARNPFLDGQRPKIIRREYVDFWRLIDPQNHKNECVVFLARGSIVRFDPPVFDYKKHSIFTLYLTGISLVNIRHSMLSYFIKVVFDVLNLYPPTSSFIIDVDIERSIKKVYKFIIEVFKLSYALFDIHSSNFRLIFKTRHEQEIACKHGLEKLI